MPSNTQKEDMRQAGHPHTPQRWAKREHVPVASGRFARPAWFDEPPPEEMARPRPGLAPGGIANAGRGRMPSAG